MAITLADLVAVLRLKDELTPAINIARKSVADFNKDFDKAAGSLTDFAKPSAGAAAAITAVTVAATAAVGAVVAVGGAIIALGMRGADVDDLANQFDVLNESIGNTGDVIGPLREAFDGTVSDFDLMQSTNKALSLGLKLTTDQLVLTGEAARVMSDRGFGPAKDVYESLTRAMATGQDRMAKQAGIDIDGAAAVEKYAKALGVEKDALTETQQIAAKKTAVMEKLASVMKESGRVQFDFADAVAKVKTTVQNLTDEFARMVANDPVVKTAMTGLLQIFADMEKVVKGNRTGMISLVQDGVIFLATSLTMLAKAAIVANDVFSALILTWKSFLNILNQLEVSWGTAAIAMQKFTIGTGGNDEMIKKQIAADEKLLASARERIAVNSKEANDTVAANAKRLDILAGVQKSLEDLTTKLKSQAGAYTDVGKAGVKAATDAAVGARAATGATAIWAADVKKLRDEYAALAAAKKIIAATGQGEGGLDSGTMKLGPGMDPGVVVGQILEINKTATIALSSLWNAVNVEINSSDENIRKFNAQLKKTAEEAAKAAVTFKGAFAQGLKDLPGVILGAIQGGGDVWAAAGAHIGGAIGKGLEKPLGDILGKAAGSLFGKALGTGAGAALGSVVPVLGTIVGGFIGNKIGNFVGGLFGGGEGKKVKEMRNQMIEAAGGIDILKARADAAGISLDKMLKASKVKDYEKAIKDLNSAFELQARANQELDATIQKYGFSIEELGPKFSAQKLDEKAAELFKDYSILTAAAVDHTAILAKMGPAINEYVQAVVAAGGTIPEQLRPILEEMIQLGTLTDAAGNKLTSLEGLTFAQSMSEMFQMLIEDIRDLVSALNGIPNVHRTVTIEEHREAMDQKNNDTIAAASGFDGIVRGPTRFLAGEAGAERVTVTPLSGGGGGDAAHETRLLRQAILTELPKIVRDAVKTRV